MTYKIENNNEIEVYGVELFVDSNASKNNEIQKKWKAFIEDSNLNGDSYGISVNYNRENYEFDYIIAAKKDSIKDNNFKKYTIPAGKYAKFKMQGVFDKKTLFDFYDRSFKELHKDELFDDSRAVNCYEYYNKEYTNMNDPKSVIYLLIPMK